MLLTATSAAAERQLHALVTLQAAREIVARLADASARLAASSAALVVPAPACGRATKAASPSSATRPNTICGDSRSKIGWKNGCAAREDFGDLRRDQRARRRP